jgi:trimethylamine---corrinoid protein Co-methyltransferase
MSLNNVSGGYLKLLTDKQVQTLHESTLKLLQSTGVVIDDLRIQGILQERGAFLDKERNIVKIPSNLVEEAIKEVPKEITFHARKEYNNLILKGNVVHTHTAGGLPFFHDWSTGKRRPALLKDLEAASRLADALENIHTVVPLVFPTDVEARVAQIEIVNSTIRNTEKVIGSTVASEGEVKFIHKLLAVVAGGEEELRENPIFKMSLSPISPLEYDADVCGALLAAAKLQIPVAILPAPMTGGTAPVTFAGALVQQNAELIVGLTITQLINPGTPVIFGPRLSVMDMRTGVAAWGTEVGMVSACETQLAHLYGIPVDAYGLCSDSKIMDQQTGYEKAQNALLPALAGANWISGAGSLESVIAASLEQLVIDDEILGTIFNVLSGFQIDEGTLALHVIDKVGPKGNFLSQLHTVEYTRKGEQYFPKISNRMGWEQWTEQGSKDIVEAGRSRAKKILDEHQVPTLDGHVLKELDAIVLDARRHYS